MSKSKKKQNPAKSGAYKRLMTASPLNTKPRRNGISRNSYSVGKASNMLAVFPEKLSGFNFRRFHVVSYMITKNLE